MRRRTLILVFLGMAVCCGTAEIAVRTHHGWLRAHGIAMGSLRLDDRLGWRATENYHLEAAARNDAGHASALRVDTDQRGFRTLGPAPPSGTSILVIGDSFTQAVEVSNDKTYAAILQAALQVRVFAYGCGGYGTLQEYLILDEVLDVIRPDIVIWQFSTNDFINNDEELERGSLLNNNGRRRPYWLPETGVYFAVPSRFGFLQQLASRYSRAGYALLQRADLLISGRRETIEAVIAREGAAHAGFQRSVRTSSALMQMVRRRSIATRVVTFSVDDGPPFYAALAEIARESGMEFVDGIPQAIRAAEGAGQPVRAADGSHWAEAGHRICARQLVSYLRAPASRDTTADAGK